MSVDLNADLGEDSGHDAEAFHLNQLGEYRDRFFTRRFQYEAPPFRGRRATSSCWSASEFFSIARISDARN